MPYPIRYYKVYDSGGKVCWRKPELMDGYCMNNVIIAHQFLVLLDGCGDGDVGARFKPSRGAAALPHILGEQQ